MNPPVHIMIDLETTGLSSNAGIVQIGAHAFSGCNFRADQYFKYCISASDNESKGYEVDSATMAWWAEKDPELRQSVFCGSSSAKEALTRFTEWCNAVSNGSLQNIYLWANHIDFDLAVLKNAFYREHAYYPFDFRKHMDYATLKVLFPQLASLHASNPTPHDALADAVYQSSIASHFLDELLSNGLISNALYTRPAAAN